ncbi:MAG TPA: DapH/DapD/GlmU-related protein [Acidimicrobiales bacterium]|nr:DapH/DapD/GlmU-related protein [Acidimicrobiales bacterium]
MSPEPGEFPRASKFVRAIWLLTTWLPSTRGSNLRVWLLRRAGATVGDGVRIGPSVKVNAPAGLTLRDGVGVARNASLDARGGVTVGTNTLVGFESVLLSFTHRYDRTDIPIKQQGMEAAPVLIGSDVWIGARAFVLPGVTIGDSSVIGTGSIVTKSLPAGVIAVGSPAKVLRNR